MKTYNLFTHPSRGIQAVKRGFSWPAFFFGLFWLLVKHLWAMAGIWSVLILMLCFVETLADQFAGPAQGILYPLQFGAHLLLWLVFGFKGNQWWEKNLLRRGYVLTGSVQAQTADKAIAQAMQTE